MKNKNLIGSEINGIKIVNYFSKNGRQYFECRCICGTLFKTRTEAIKTGATKSCGCLTGDLISEANRLPDNEAIINIVYRNYKNGAAKRKLKFNLSIDEFKKFIFGNCQYCGCEPQLSKFAGQDNRRDRFLSYNGIDRKDNNIGYEVFNCISCCSICNAAKSDMPYIDFINWIERLIKYNVHK